MQLRLTAESPCFPRKQRTRARPRHTQKVRASLESHGRVHGHGTHLIKKRAHDANTACSRALSRTPGTAGTRSYLAARENITCTLHARPLPLFAQQRGKRSGPRPRGCMKGTPMPPYLSSALRALCQGWRDAPADPRSGLAPLPSRGLSSETDPRSAQTERGARFKDLRLYNLPKPENPRRGP